jgi:hypothetical protein
MLIDAAIDGQGIALARTMHAANDLIARRLVRPFRTALPLKNTYWIVCPKTTRALPKRPGPSNPAELGPVECVGAIHLEGIHGRAGPE